MKKILVLLLTITLVVIMVGAAFTAAFSDIEQSTDNAFSAGTLDLRLNGLDNPISSAVSLSVANWRPSDTQRHCWSLTNAGTITGQPWFEVTNITNLENSLLEMEISAGDPTDDVGELGDQIEGQWKFAVPGQGNFLDIASLIDINDMGIPGTEFGRSELPVLAPNDSVQICLDATFKDLPSPQNNLSQDDSVSFDVVYHLEQP
jgi:predicted ribosomally synthesized peptide with SipW-like signal peptide